MWSTRSTQQMQAPLTGGGEGKSFKIAPQLASDRVGLWLLEPARSEKVERPDVFAVEICVRRFRQQLGRGMRRARPYPGHTHVKRARVGAGVPLPRRGALYTRARARARAHLVTLSLPAPPILTAVPANRQVSLPSLSP